MFRSWQEQEAVFEDATVEENVWEKHHTLEVNICQQKISTSCEKLWSKSRKNVSMKTFVRKNFRHLITISSFLNDESEGHNTSSEEDTRQLGNNSNVQGFGSKQPNVVFYGMFIKISRKNEAQQQIYNSIMIIAYTPVSELYISLKYKMILSAKLSYKMILSAYIKDMWNMCKTGHHILCVTFGN